MKNRKVFLPVLAALSGAALVLASCAASPSPAEVQTGPASGASVTPASEYWTGDGGAGLSVAVLAPEANGLDAGEEYLPAMVQGVLVGDFTKFSAMTILDRLNLDKVIAEGETGYYADESDFPRLGEITNMRYLLTGSLQKTGSGFSLQLKITEAATGVSKAAYTGGVTAAELEDLTGVKRASADLLAQLGVSLTEAGKTNLAGVDASNARAETALARGVTAQRGGTEVEALTYYFQAASYDASLTEAASRVNILSANITSGNMGEDIRNDIQWRDQWRARLAEAEQVYANYARQEPLYSLVYDVDLKHGETNYSNNTVPISGVTLDLVPDAAWFNMAGSVVRVINVVREGLLATGQAGKWELNWPRNSVGNSPFGDRDQRFDVVVELVNSDGKTIGSERVTMRSGYDVEWAGDSNNRSIRRLVPRMRGLQSISFNRVNAYDITDRLTVRIAGIDGEDAETAARTRGVNILTEAEYARLPEVIAGEDSRNVSRVMRELEINASGEITGYKGAGGELIIPATIFGLPVTAIGNEAFTKVEIEREYRSDGTSYTNTVYRGRGLTGVTIPGSVTSIGDNAFRGNQLTGVIIPNGVTSIGISAFAGNQLTSITIPDNITWHYHVLPLIFLPIPILDASFGHGFESAYDKNGKKAGTYTRPDAGSRKWTYRP